MNKNRFSKPVAVAAGFFFLCAAPGLTRAQTSPPTPAPIPRKTLPAVRPKKDTRPTDDFAGLQYTDEQKGRIDQIHEEMKSRMDITAKDEKSDTPRGAGGLVSGAASKAVVPLVEASR